VQKLGAKREGATGHLRAGEAVSRAEAGAVAAAAGGIALRNAAQLRPRAPAESRRRHARPHMHTRLQCAARHPRRSLSLPSVATLTRSYATHAIMGVKRISTASVRFSRRDTRDRYLACRHPDAEALRRQSARTKPVGPRARYLLAVDVPAGTSGLAKLVKLAVEGLPIGQK